SSVVPGKFDVLWRRPLRRLKSVVLPVLGLPSSAMRSIAPGPPASPPGRCVGAGCVVVPAGAVLMPGRLPSPPSPLAAAASSLASFQRDQDPLRQRPRQPDAAPRPVPLRTAIATPARRLGHIPHRRPLAALDRHDA